MSDLPMLLIAIAGLAVGTYVFRFAGPYFGRSDETGNDAAEAAASDGKPMRRSPPAWLDSLMSRGAVVLLVAVVATTALTEGQDFAGIARPAGVLAGGVLAYFKMSFIIVILVAAGVTAGLRLLGVG